MDIMCRTIWCLIFIVYLNKLADIWLIKKVEFLEVLQLALISSLAQTDIGGDWRQGLEGATQSRGDQPSLSLTDLPKSNLSLIIWKTPSTFQT